MSMKEPSEKYDENEDVGQESGSQSTENLANISTMASDADETEQLLKRSSEALKQKSAPDDSKMKLSLFNKRLPQRAELLTPEELADIHYDLNAERSASIVEDDPDHPDESLKLTIVQHKASRFGRGVSSTDAAFDQEDSEFASDTSQGAASSGSSPLTSSKVKDTHRKSLGKEESKGFSPSKLAGGSQSHHKDRKSSPLRGKHSITPVKDLEKSPLLRKQSGSATPVSSTNSSIPKMTIEGEEGGDIGLASPTKSDFSSEDDSQFLNTSTDADQTLSPSMLSDDVGVCSKYSHLSEDGSETPTPKNEEEEKEATLEDRQGLENPMNYSHVFTEYVDTDEFVTSLGKQRPHTEDTFGGRSQEHFSIMVKNGPFKNVKAYLRRSLWPAESDARKNVWVILLGYRVKMSNDDYSRLATELFTDVAIDDLSYPAFVDEGHLNTYFLTPHGKREVKCIVAVTDDEHPEIVYCPLLYSLAALFLHYMDPSSCYNCIQSMLKSDKTEYLTQARVPFEATKLVVRDLCKKYNKQGYNLIVRSSTNVDLVFANWLWWIFRDLPFPYLVRIVDSYILEGVKVLYRMALAIIALFAKDMNKRGGGRSTPISDINTAISRFCQTMPYPARKLLKVGFGIRGLSRKEIAKLQNHSEIYVRNNPVKQDIPRVDSSGSTEQSSRSGQGPTTSQHAESSVLSHDMKKWVPHIYKGTRIDRSRQILGPEQRGRGENDSSSRASAFTINSASSIKMLSEIESQFMDDTYFNILWGWIPRRFHLQRLKLIFSSDEHGTALRTLYLKTQHAARTVMVIKTTDDEIFGAYCSYPWFTRHESNQPNVSFFGNGETFVFTLHPKVRRYTWKAERKSDLFMAGDDSMLIIGSGNGEAIYLDQFFNNCLSTHCNTFDNEPLASTQDFKCRLVEVFGFFED